MNENDKKALNRITKQAAKITQSELTSRLLITCIVTEDWEGSFNSRPSAR